MRKSIIQEEKRCFFCGRVTDLERHHIFYGTANRKLSDADGLTVWLCQEHHRGKSGVHQNHDRDLILKQYAEELYLIRYEKTIDDFIERYGRNYLEEI